MYNKFIDYLKQKQVKNDLIKHLGEFITKIFNNYIIRQIVMDKKYLLFFKVKKEEEIDFTNDMILVYEIKGKTIYYDIQKNVQLKKEFSLLTNKKFKEYYYIVGKWINDEIINLEEKEN